MGSEPYLVASCLKAVLAQRYIRRLCPQCREEYQPDQAEIKAIKQILNKCGVASIKRLHEIEQLAVKDSVGDDVKSLSTTPSGIARLWRANPDGCPHCKFSGFHGRVGTCEAIETSEKLKKVFAKNPASSDIQNTVIDDGMIPLQLDGLVKALRGLTTLEEVLTITGSW